MTECYEAALAANTTTVIYVCLGLLIGLALEKLISLAANQWAIHRDRKRLAKMLRAEEATAIRLEGTE